MNRKIYFIFIFIALLVVSLKAQVIVPKKEIGEGAVFFLNEMAAIVKDEEGSIKIDVVLPVEQRPKEYQDIDLKQGDEFLMVDSKRLKSVKELEKIYNEVDVGGTIKLGVRRGEEMFIVAFNKIDPEKMPKRKFMIRKAEPGAIKPGEDGKVFSEQIKIDNKDWKVKPLLELGLILKEADNKVKVEKVIADVAKKTSNFDAKAGDVISSLNGKKIEMVQQFSAIYDNIETGTDVKLKIIRENKEIEFSFKKPKPENVMIIPD